MSQTNVPHTKFWLEFKDFVNDHLPLSNKDSSVFELAGLPLMMTAKPKTAVEFYLSNKSLIVENLPLLSKLETEKIGDKRDTKATESNPEQNQSEYSRDDSNEQLSEENAKKTRSKSEKDLESNDQVHHEKSKSEKFNSQNTLRIHGQDDSIEVLDPHKISSDRIEDCDEDDQHKESIGDNTGNLIEQHLEKNDRKPIPVLEQNQHEKIADANKMVIISIY